MEPVRLLFVDNEVKDFLLHRITLARVLRESGVEVHVAVPQEPGIEALREHGFPVHVIHMKRKSMSPLDEIRTFASLLAVYRALKPDLIHHIRLKPVLHGGMAARVAGAPAVVHMLTGLGHLFTASSRRNTVLRAIVTRGLRASLRHGNHRVIFQNPDDRSCLVESGVLPEARAVLIRGSGVDLAQFRPTPEPQGPAAVLMACRMLWEKGVGEFVAAARSLRSRGVAAKFILVGSPDPGHPSAVPAETLREWHARGDIEWWGWKDNMSALLQGCHIVCLPSAYGEGVPRTLIEAAASGRPIVTTDAPGCREIVRHGVNGLLVPTHDVPELERALARLIGDPELRARMGARGREIAAEEFSMEQVIQQTVSVYNAVLPERFPKPHMMSEVV